MAGFFSTSHTVTLISILKHVVLLYVEKMLAILTLFYLWDNFTQPISDFRKCSQWQVSSVGYSSERDQHQQHLKMNYHKQDHWVLLHQSLSCWHHRRNYLVRSTIDKLIIHFVLIHCPLQTMKIISEKDVGHLCDLESYQFVQTAD